MELINNFFVVENAVTNRFCNHVLEYGNYLKEQVGTTADFDEKNFTEYDKQQLEKTRKSKIIWMKDKWIYREIQPVVHQVNSAAGWNYDWELTEPVQYTKYEGSQKQHYDWHTDSGTNIDENGHIRKISASLMLVDDDKYEGGDFQVCIPKPNGNKIINIKLKSKGTMVFFPSYVWHRVIPVTKGIRYSLVCWNKGFPFK